MNSPEITIIVPVYNVEKYLNDCIESIINQSYPDFELILVPGASSDNSTGICEEWQAKDSRIKIVIQDKNNCAYARNKALKHASGKYICFCDADDLYDKDYLKIMHAAVTEGDADVAECMLSTVDPDLNNYSVNSFLEYNKIFGHEIMERQGPPSLCKYISKREIWINNNIQFPEIRNASDMSVYSLIWAYSPKVNYVYKSLYIYRVGQTSLTTSEVKLNDRITNLRMACEYISSQFKSRGIFSEHRLTLISQAECHLSNLLTYAKGTSLEDEVPKILSQIVKDCYDVEHTMYDHSVMGVGTKGMLLLSSYVHMDPKADYTCISGMSLAQLCDPDMQARFRKSCEENQHDVVIVDLIEEAPIILSSLANISAFIQNWAVGCGIFVSCISKNNKPPRVFLLEKHIPQKYYNGSEIEAFDNLQNIVLADEILIMLRENFLSLCPESILIPSIPDELYIADNKDTYDTSAYDRVYYYEKIADHIHENSEW